jgi:hypothetical protein
MLAAEDLARNDVSVNDCYIKKEEPERHPRARGLQLCAGVTPELTV